MYTQKITDETLDQGQYSRLVNAAENRETATAILQRSGEFLDDGRFSGATHSQVADADDEAAKIAFPHDPVSIEPETSADRALIELRTTAEEALEDPGTKSPASIEDHVDRELLKLFGGLAHEDGARRGRVWSPYQEATQPLL